MSERRLGRIARLQVQRAIVAHKGMGYDPEPIVEVERAAIGPQGVSGLHGGWYVLDIHHTAHPSGRGGGSRTISMGFTAHYREMEARFGAVMPGVGGENVIVEADGRVTEDDLTGTVVILAETGEIPLTGARVASPCVEFTSFLLGLDRVAERDEVADHLEFLGGGTRGFILDGALIERPIPVGLGDRVILRD